MKISTLINILIIMLMGHIFTPSIMKILDTNRIPMISVNFFGYRYILILIQMLIIVYKPKVFFRKPMLFIYLYYIVFLLFRISGYYDTTSQWFWKYHLFIYLSVLIYTYYLSRKDFTGLAIIGTALLIIIFVASLINLVQLFYNPMQARAYGGFKGDVKFGIFGYSLPSTLSFFLPILVGFIKYGNISNFKRTLIIIEIITIYFSILLSSITVPIIIASIGLIFALMGLKKIKSSIIISSFLLLIVIFLPRIFVADIFYSASNSLQNESASKRLYSIGYGIEYGINIKNASTPLELRARRIPLNLNQFVKYPIFGAGYEGNAHLFWLNYLAQFGLIGTISLILILYNQYKISMKMFSESFKFYYLLSMFLFLISGLLKAYSPLFFLMIIFVIPTIFYISYANIRKSSWKIKN